LNGKTTRDKLIQIVTTEPNKYTRNEVAGVIGVSRERIRYLGNELGIQNLFRKWESRALCIECGKGVSRIGGLCRKCWDKNHSAKKVKLVCETCDKEFERKESETKRSKHHFCGRICFGQYAGKHYGFDTGPRNIKERRKLLVSELEFSVVSKAFISKMMHPEYLQVIERCLQLSDDEALKVKCPSMQVAKYIRHIAKIRDFMAISRTEPNGIFVYISKK